MTPRTVAAIAACVILTAEFTPEWSAGFRAPRSEGLRRAPDTLEVRVVCDGHIALTLRDPRGRAASCTWDSTHSSIPGCRAFSMVEIYDEMGEDGVSQLADAADASKSDTTSTEANEKNSPEAVALDTPSEDHGTLRFAAVAPQSGEWLLEARVPANAGYLAATLWLEVCVASRGGGPHVALGKWAELAPGGRVRSRLRVGRDGSVELIRTATSGDFAWSTAERLSESSLAAYVSITVIGMYTKLVLMDPLGRLSFITPAGRESTFAGCQRVDVPEVGGVPDSLDYTRFYVRDPASGVYRLSMLATRSSSIRVDASASWRHGGQGHSVGDGAGLGTDAGDSVSCAISVGRRVRSLWVNIADLAKHRPR